MYKKTLAATLGASLLVMTGCNKDDKVKALADANATLVKELEAAKSSEDAKAAYDKQLPTIEPLWGELKEARGFQLSEEATKTLETTTIESVQSVCALELRGAFDEESKETYTKLCEGYAGMLEIDVDTARLTVIDKKFAVESFADDLKKAEGEAKKGDLPMYSCSSIETHAETAKKFGFDGQLAKYKELCNVTGPIAALTIAVEAAEKARAAKPDEAVLSECYNATQSMAAETLAKAGKKDDEAVASLTSRWAKACPKG